MNWCVKLWGCNGSPSKRAQTNVSPVLAAIRRASSSRAGRPIAFTSPVGQPSDQTRAFPNFDVKTFTECFRLAFCIVVVNARYYFWCRYKVVLARQVIDPVLLHVHQPLPAMLPMRDSRCFMAVSSGWPATTPSFQPPAKATVSKLVNNRFFMGILPGGAS